MPSMQEIITFNTVRQRALQELAEYKGSRVSTYSEKSYYKRDGRYYDHDDVKYKLRQSTEMYRKPDLTIERVDNITWYTRIIQQYDPNTAKSIEEAYDFLRQQLHAAHNNNKSISSKYGKHHITFNEAIDMHGIFGIFKRTCHQAHSDLALERAIEIVKKVKPKTFLAK